MSSLALVALLALSTAVCGTEEMSPAPFVLDLTAKVARAPYKNHLKQQLSQDPSLDTNVATLAGAHGDQDYLVDITVGNQAFKVMVDTGSSDTWLIKEGFRCYSGDTGRGVDESECAVGPRYNPAQSQTFVPYADRRFDASYGSGDTVQGSVGFEQLTVGGLTIQHQEIGLVDNTSYRGDGISSGVLGLAYPYITDVYNTTDRNADGDEVAERYSSFFLTAVAEGAVSAPYFSLALNRGNWSMMWNSTYDRPLGHLAFGGMAPVEVTDNSATVPVRKESVRETVGANETWQYEFYTVAVDAYRFANASTAPADIDRDAIVDSGSTFNRLPTDVAAAYNALWTPPARNEHGLFYVECNATAPPFSVVLGGREFAVDPRDQVVPSGRYVNGTQLCVSGTQDGLNNIQGTITLGDVFLRNVVATFHVSTTEDAQNKITFTERAKY